MRYVQRDPNTKAVTGHFANPQSYAQEELSDDHPDIIAFNNPTRLPAEPSTLDRLKARVDDLEQRLAKLGV